MRIAFLTPEFVTEPNFSGGLANYLGRVTVALSKRGHDVHVVTRSDNYDEPSVDYSDVKVHRVVPLWDSRMVLDHADALVPRQYRNAYQDVKAAWCIRRRWYQLNERKAFDLVQAANVGACGYFFKREQQVPVVTRLSSFRPLWDTLAGAEINRGLRLRWDLERRAIEGTRFHYAPSEFVARETAQACKVDRIDVIETPFIQEVTLPDDRVFRAQFAGLKYLLFFGGHTQMKGTHLIAQSLSAVFAKDPAIHCVFAGNDTNLAPDGGSMRAYIRRLNDRHLDRLHFLDPLKHDQLYPIIENSTAVLIPSLADNLPNTCLEAMGLGKAVIAAKGSCFEQLITSGENGFLAERNCANSLAETIVSVLALSPDSRDSIGASARDCVRRLHPDRAIPKLVDYYDSLISRFHNLN